LVEASSNVINCNYNIFYSLDVLKLEQELVSCFSTSDYEEFKVWRIRFIYDYCSEFTRYKNYLDNFYKNEITMSNYREISTLKTSLIMDFYKEWLSKYLVKLTEWQNYIKSKNK
jgi:hypothetical protein